MVVPMDSLTRLEPGLGPDGPGHAQTLALPPELDLPAMPAEAPLAMPVQSLSRFDASGRRRWLRPELARTP